MSARQWTFVLMIALASSPVYSQAPGVFLGDLTWPEAHEKFSQVPVVVVPIAAGAKEHGPHLPMNADRVVMEYLIDAAIRSQEVIVVPPILHGWFPAFREFPGTEVSEPAVFQDYVFQIGMSLARHGAQRLLFLNTGISRATGLPISIAAREIRVQAGVPTLVVSWDDLETDAIDELAEQREGGHGDEIETSINLYLQPGLVQMQLAVRDYGERPQQNYPGYQPGVLSRDPNDPLYSATGIYGDATLATADKGRQALDILVGEWLRAVAGFAETPLRRD